MACEACGELIEPEIRVGGIPGQDGRTYSLRRCGGCGLVRAYPLPTDEQLCRFYSDCRGRCKQEIVEGPNAVKANRAIIEDGKVRVAYMERYAPAIVRGSLLDVGCGYGFFLQAASDMGYVPEGIDIDRKAVAFSRQHFPHAIRERSLDQIGELGSRYDAVTMWQVLEHVLHPDQCIQGVFSVLKPGGVFAGSLPNIGGIYARLRGKKWYHIIPPEHLNFFDEQSLTKALQRAGFEVLFVGTIPMYAAPYVAWGLRARMVRWAQARSSGILTAVALKAHRFLTLFKRYVVYRALNALILGLRLGGNSLFFVAVKPAEDTG